MLFELSVNAGRVMTHEELLHRVWGPANPAGGVRTIRTHLMRLRRLLGEDAENPIYIFAEPRVGYRMAVGEAGQGKGEPSAWQHPDRVSRGEGRRSNVAIVS